MYLVNLHSPFEVWFAHHSPFEGWLTHHSPFEGWFTHHSPLNKDESPLKKGEREQLLKRFTLKKDENVHPQGWYILFKGDSPLFCSPFVVFNFNSPSKRMDYSWEWTCSSSLRANLLRSCFRSPFFKGDSPLLKGEWWVKRANHPSKGEWRFTRYTLAKNFLRSFLEKLYTHVITSFGIQTNSSSLEFD